MHARTPASVAYLMAVILLWGLAMPAVLISDAGGPAFPWRGPGQVAGGIVLLVAGVVLVDTGARTLAVAGIGLFGVGPGSRLVRSGVYGRIRNPIDVGTVLIAFATWVSLSVELMWVIPAGGLIYFGAGVGPYEDRRLFEVFGDDFKEYRSAVPKWLPRRRSGADS